MSSATSTKRPPLIVSSGAGRVVLGLWCLGTSGMYGLLAVAPWIAYLLRSMGVDLWTPVENPLGSLALVAATLAWTLYCVTIAQFRYRLFARLEPVTVSADLVAFPRDRGPGNIAPLTALQTLMVHDSVIILGLPGLRWSVVRMIFNPRQADGRAVSLFAVPGGVLAPRRARSQLLAFLRRAMMLRSEAADEAELDALVAQARRDPGDATLVEKCARLAHSLGNETIEHYSLCTLAEDHRDDPERITDLAWFYLHAEDPEFHRSDLADELMIMVSDILEERGIHPDARMLHAAALAAFDRGAVTRAVNFAEESLAMAPGNASLARQLEVMRTHADTPPPPPEAPPDEAANLVRRARDRRRAEEDEHGRPSDRSLRDMGI